MKSWNSSHTKDKSLRLLYIIDNKNKLNQKIKDLFILNITNESYVSPRSKYYNPKHEINPSTPINQES